MFIYDQLRILFKVFIKAEYFLLAIIEFVKSKIQGVIYLSNYMLRKCNHYLHFHSGEVLFPTEAIQNQIIYLKSQGFPDGLTFVTSFEGIVSM